MKGIKCNNCGKLIGKIEYGKVEIKCKCGTVNQINVTQVKPFGEKLIYNQK